MTYVAISTALKEAVNKKITSMSGAEHGTNPEVTIELAPTDPFTMKLVWGEYMHLAGQLPEAWMNKARYARFTYDDLSNEGAVFSNNGYVSFPTDMWVPPGRRDANINVSHLLDEPEFAAYRERERRRKDIETRWDTVHAQVEKFMAACKSLNEGLKLWPQLAIYIPDHFIEKVNTGSTRDKVLTGAAAILAEMDTDTLVGAAVIARMSGASK